MLKQIQERRSHFLKEFNGAIAPDTLIQEILNASIWAPSHKLTLPFRFIVIRQENLMPFSKILIESYQSRTLEIDPQKISKMDSLSTKLSHAIAIVLKPSNKIPLWEEYACLGAAIQNVQLMLSVQNHFGGYWTTGNESNQPLIKNHLEITEDEIHCGYFFVGGIDHKRTSAMRPEPNIRWIYTID